MNYSRSFVRNESSNYLNKIVQDSLKLCSDVHLFSNLCLLVMESEDDLDDQDNLGEYDELIMPGEKTLKDNFL